MVMYWLTRYHARMITRLSLYMNQSYINSFKCYSIVKEKVDSVLRKGNFINISSKPASNIFTWYNVCYFHGKGNNYAILQL